MNNDVATLQVIADTLENDPQASQRILAENAGMSIGLMNAVIKRFVERGWLMLTNVNLRKLSYAITPEGIAELTARSQSFAKRTFALANRYNDKLLQCVAQAKKEGKNKVCLYGQSYIKFLLVYACQTLGVSFVEKDEKDPVQKNAFCIAGEQCEEEVITKLTKKGCTSLLALLED